MKKLIKFLLLIAIFSSCNVEQRIARIIKRHPELVKSDTVKVTDTIVVKGVSKDTTFFYRTSDTVRLQKDKLEIKYYFNTKDSTVYLEGKYKGDTIYKDRIVYINKIDVAKALTFGQRAKIWLFDNWWWILLIVSAIVFIFRKIIGAYLGIYKQK